MQHDAQWMGNRKPRDQSSPAGKLGDGDETMSEKLLTAQEAAEILNVSLWRFYQLCREYGLPHVRMGRAVRVDPDTLDDWISAGGTANDGNLIAAAPDLLEACEWASRDTVNPDLRGALDAAIAKARGTDR